MKLRSIKDYTSLDYKVIKSENITHIEQRIRYKLEKCSKIIAKLKCFSDYCEYGSNPEAWHIPSRCNIRICPICKTSRQSRIVSKYSQYLNFMKYPRFMTLTLRKSYGLTKKNKKRMDTACQELFRELRQAGYKLSKYIKALELKKLGNNKFKFHYHIIYEGSYIPQKTLSEKWEKHSKGSFIVDIRKVYNRTQALFYISKYIAKAVDYDISLRQYAKIMKMRFFNSYGFKGIKLKKRVWAICRHCGARMRYGGSYEIEHVLKKCVLSEVEKIN